MNAPVLSVAGLGKSYPTYASAMHRIGRWFGLPIRPSEEYWATRNVSFDIRPGEAVGLIGQNGAGKSTTLKLITGTVQPTEGTIAVNGRVSAILELGLGFNPDFTGRENVRHSGGLLGFSSAEITRLMPEIEDFAELGDFFDQPLRVYSSGMMARLAFSLATAVCPDVLIVDEVLSVGDSYFQHKSFDRIRQFKEEGAAIIIVSHAMGDVRELCERVILLDKGAVLKDGAPDEVIDYYNALIAEKENANLSIEQKRRKDGWLHTEFGDKRATMDAIDLFEAGGEKPVKLVFTGAQLEVRARIKVEVPLPELVIGHRITDRTGHVVWGSNTWHAKQVVKDLKPGDMVESVLAFECRLGPGSYAVSFGLHTSDTHLEDCYHKAENQLVFDVMNTDRTTFIGTNALDAQFNVKAVHAEDQSV